MTHVALIAIKRLSRCLHRPSTCLYRPSAYRLYGLFTDKSLRVRLARIQYLIGNTDWSAVTGHNVVHIQDRRGLLSAVPFDFDFSGLVNAHYASPPPSLPLRTVRQRLFRGFCDPAPNWEGLFSDFAIRRADIEAVVAQVPALEPSERASVRNYLGEFFDVLASPKRRQSKIVSACRPLEGRPLARFVPRTVRHILETLPGTKSLPPQSARTLLAIDRKRDLATVTRS